MNLVNYFKVEDLSDSEKILYKHIGRAFLKLFENNISGQFYVSAHKTRRKWIIRALKDYMAKGEPIDIKQWASALNITYETMRKIHRDAEKEFNAHKRRVKNASK